MEFVKPDLWSLGANAPSVTSFIALPSMSEDLWSRLEMGPVSTSRCGLGWSFVVGLEAIASPSWGKNIPSTCIKIFMATHAIATSELCKLSITVIASSDSPLDLESIHDTEVCLPAAGIFPLASYRTSVPYKAGTKFAVAQSVLTIRVELPSTFTLASDLMEGSQRRLRRVLRDSLGGSEVGDTTFCLFTRSSGLEVMGLDVVFANSTMLRGHSASLDSLLDTKKVAAEDLLKAPRVPYGYHSDSDLEEDDLEDDINAVQFTDADLEFKSVGTSSDRQSERQPKLPSLSPNFRLKDAQSAIIIPDIAFQTWRAFIYYLYTGGEIHFKALHSASPALHKVKSDIAPTSCSPKSMYRLATKLDFEKLKNVSLTSIIRGLSKDNIIAELFSHFTSLYPEVQEAEAEALIPFLDDSVFVHDLLHRMEVAAGSLPHCGSIIAAITGRMIKLAIEERSFKTCALEFNNGTAKDDKHFAKEDEIAFGYDKAIDEEDKRQTLEEDYEIKNGCQQVRTKGKGKSKGRYAPV